MSNINNLEIGDNVLVIEEAGDLGDAYLGTVTKWYDKYQFFHFKGVCLRSGSVKNEGAFFTCVTDIVIRIQDLTELEIILYNIDKEEIKKWLTT